MNNQTETLVFCALLVSDRGHELNDHGIAKLAKRAREIAAIFDSTNQTPHDQMHHDPTIDTDSSPPRA